jgi:membrane protein DedA with SNARE-associated domain
MCLIVAAVMLIMSFNMFMANNIIGALIAFSISLFFIWLMVNNIKTVKKMKKDRGKK